MLIPFVYLLGACLTPIDVTLFSDATPSEGLEESTTGECALEADGSLTRASEGRFIAQDATVEAHREACTTTMHATAGAIYSTLEITLTEWEATAPATLYATDLLGTLMADPVSVNAGEALEVSLTQSGEILLHLEPSDPETSANDYALTVDCIAGCEGAYTRYPIVLMHGLGGSESFGELGYFYQVREVLEPEGYALASPSVSPFSTTEARGDEWDVHFQQLVDDGVGRKFNLIGHSQAGLDARYLVSVLGRSDWVASIISVGTPHHGTPIADLITGAIELELVDDYWIDFGADLFVALFGLTGDDNSLVASMGALTTDTLEAFNASVLDHDDVYYASWAGVTCGGLDFSCQDACRGETVDPAMAISNLILELYGDENDGLVITESAVWGDYRGEICADHADQVGLFGDTATDAFDHLAFYRDEFRRLADLGL
jgi:triacylglycerol lipase